MITVVYLPYVYYNTMCVCVACVYDACMCGCVSVCLRTCVYVCAIFTCKSLNAFTHILAFIYCVGGNFCRTITLIIAVKTFSRKLLLVPLESVITCT